jgi:hypothetical protein
MIRIRRGASAIQPDAPLARSENVETKRADARIVGRNISSDTTRASPYGGAAYYVIWLRSSNTK